MEAGPLRAPTLVLLTVALLFASCGPGEDPFRAVAAPPRSLVTPAASPTPSPAPSLPGPTAVTVPDDATAGLRWARLEWNGVAALVPAAAQPGRPSPWAVDHYVDPCRGAGWPYTIVRATTGDVVLRLDWPEARFRVRGQPPTRGETLAIVHMLSSVEGTWAAPPREIRSPSPTPAACAAWDGFGPPPR
ncbi:MAG TPA: hypothetical protein VNM43_01600 [Dehalococcoidia bacterium]|nr:hypothetical protein [Dehalococcoidia bacterium]